MEMKKGEKGRSRVGLPVPRPQQPVAGGDLSTHKTGRESKLTADVHLKRWMDFIWKLVGP